MGLALVAAMFATFDTIYATCDVTAEKAVASCARVN
jgi:hypothetical protein